MPICGDHHLAGVQALLTATLKMPIRLWLGVLAWILAACAVSALSASATGKEIPPAPDYAEPTAWAAWPGRPSGAQAVPSGTGLIDREGDAQADVFFVHPTTFLTYVVANAPYDAQGIPMLAVDRIVLRFEAAAFNGCCRIFAPHYRQASVAAFIRHNAESIAAIHLAYSDVLRAFDYYIAHENNGRPFIVASHSQGSIHTMRLLQERIAKSPLQARMVAAYVIGYWIPEEIEYAGVPVCASAQQTECLIHWASVRLGATRRPAKAWIWLGGRYQPVGDRRLVCVNPLTWRRDDTAPAALNLGALPRTWTNRPMPRPLPGVTGATCEAGLLTVSLPLWARPAFSGLLTLFGSYHEFDYQLFYTNVRQNANDRVAAFLARPAAH